MNTQTNLSKTLPSVWTKNFSFLWLGGIASLVGFRIYEINLSWFVLDTTGSSAVLGTLFLVFAIPNMVFILLGGSLADNVSKVKIMFWSDLTRVLAVGLLVACYLFGWTPIWLLFAVSLVFGASNAMFVPAKDSILPLLVQEEQLQKANSFRELANQASFILGPLLAALAVSTLGSGKAFLVAAFVILLSAISVKQISYREDQKEADAKVTWKKTWEDIKTGFTLLRGKPTWIFMFLALAVFNIGWYGPIMVGLPYLMNIEMNLGIGSYSLMEISLAIGMLVGGLVCSKLNIRRVGLVIFAAIIVIGTTFSTLGFMNSLYGIAPIIAICGAMLVIINVLLYTTLQKEVDTKVLGTVMGLLTFIVVGTDPLTFFLAGIGFDMLPHEVVFLLGGGLIAVTGLVALMNKSVRALTSESKEASA